MPNRLQYETSPYLLQHAHNPVDWYPWGEEAFKSAREEDKPVFLSIGYSTCHWCHVMARESFEDEKIAEKLNRWFIPVKVDREERPDLDSVYMAVCEAFTGSGGWPMSVFLTPEGEPFYAGTYFPKDSRGGMVGFGTLLEFFHGKWESNRPALLRGAKEAVAHLRREADREERPGEDGLLERAIGQYRRAYDRENGGFGGAPKFPAPQNLLFLLAWARRREESDSREMALHTLGQMARGGLFDHIGGGFCRYSTDERFLAPHFEKMLYDNALLTLAYCEAYSDTGEALFLRTARRTADYVLRDLTSPQGGFYSAQDADSEGEEGKFYLFTPGELVSLLGPQKGRAFCGHFDITEGGNFEGKSVPNLLHSDPGDRSFDPLLETVCAYRRERGALSTDDKILTAWNGLMISALCGLYRVCGEEKYLACARRADGFLWENLWDGGLYVSFRQGKRGQKGFLDDYAALAFAQLALYRCTLEGSYLTRARALCREALERFWDGEKGGFYLYGKESEALILRPKETYDGAMPSGNSLMAWCLVRLSFFFEEFSEPARRQLDFLSRRASRYPMGHGMFLLALLEHQEPPPCIRVVPGEGVERKDLLEKLPPKAAVLLEEPGGAYPLKDGKTTFYVCQGKRCLPPTNECPH